MNLYNLRTASTAPTFSITKFDEDFNVLSSYTITPKGFDYTCDCPANNRSVITKPCRHRRMMKALLPVVDTGQFYDPDTGRFCEMLGDPHREPPEGGEAQPEAVPLSDAKVAGEALGSSAKLLGIIKLTPLTPDQEAYLKAVQDSTNKYDPNTIIGGPRPAPTIRRR